MLRFDRLDEMMKINGWKAPFVCAQIGKSRQWLSDLRRGNAKLTTENLTKLSELFGCTEEYLTGKSDDMFGIEGDPDDDLSFADGIPLVVTKKTPTAKRSEREEQIFNLIQGLSPEQQDMVIAQLRGLLDAQKR